MFHVKNAQRLEHFSRLSQQIGARSDYVQGGGGNTSVKLADGLMAIKASGFCLSDIRHNNAYAVLDYEALRRFYYDNELDLLDNVEQQGSACTKENTKQIDGMATLRPSVEAGFHSLLNTYVLHTHSVYANLAACSTCCREIAKIAFSDASYSWGWVDYTDPGSKLTFAIRDELRRVELETGHVPSVILMQNHGIIVHDDDPDVCMEIHADANRRIAKHFGISETAFPSIHVEEMAGGLYRANTPYLKAAFQENIYPYDVLMEQPLYPDQMVFLADTFFMNQDEISRGQCVASTKTGELVLYMPEKKAITLTETLTAIFFIMETIRASGYPLSTMGDAAKNFIANWESEKYRKSLAGKKG